MPGESSIEEAYRWCRELAASHYENFPVASWLLPRSLRNPVAAIYAFARTADDIADEGPAEPEQRLEQLDRMGKALEQISGGTVPAGSLYTALGDTIRTFQLPAGPLHDLLWAFRQDVTRKRYANIDKLLEYCRCSANPVGRLLLHLSGQYRADNERDSDSVCTGLQLTNFLQDIGQDYSENGRIYIPMDEMARFGVGEDAIAARRSSPAMRRLLDFQISRAREMLLHGAGLARRLGGRFGLELRLIVLGGLRTLHRLQHQGDNLFSRPRLGKADRAWMVWMAARPQFPLPRIDSP